MDGIGWVVQLIGNAAQAMILVAIVYVIRILFGF